MYLKIDEFESFTVVKVGRGEEIISSARIV